MILGGAKVIDASGKLLMPGGIDTSVHLQQTFMNASTQDDFYTGTKTQDLRRVDRAPYSGDVAAVANAGRKDSAPSEGDVPMQVTTRPGGIRDLHESSLVCQALKWMTTFLSGPLLESWLHLVDAPVVSGNRGNPRLTHSHRSLI